MSPFPGGGEAVARGPGAPRDGSLPYQQSRSKNQGGAGLLTSGSLALQTFYANSAVKHAFTNFLSMTLDSSNDADDDDDDNWEDKTTWTQLHSLGTMQLAILY